MDDSNRLVREVRVESAKACAIPDLLCSLRTFGISYWIRFLSPLSSISSLSSRFPTPCRDANDVVLGDIPLSGAERDWTFRKETQLPALLKDLHLILWDRSLRI
ncbi:unnamed protein product [Lasius platythorax]|uniref:Uncharacterized protein n=1 Tax=Lasius platythorax TaxID=488582 RepID=A0AAV2N4R3_9HYME